MLLRFARSRGKAWDSGVDRGVFSFCCGFLTKKRALGCGPEPNRAARVYLCCWFVTWDVRGGRLARNSSHPCLSEGGLDEVRLGQCKGIRKGVGYAPKWFHSAAAQSEGRVAAGTRRSPAEA